jgi:hypothetical protein
MNKEMAQMGKKRTSRRDLVRNPKGKRPLGKAMRRVGYNIKRYLEVRIGKFK